MACPYEAGWPAAGATMRTEKEIFDLVLRVARADDRVRAVTLNGSRANPAARPDDLRDYDIVYLVTEMDSFLSDPTWVDVFGDRIMMQTPEAMAMFPPTLGGRFTYLMLFEDGTRIDLMLILLQDKDDYIVEDTQTVVLLDKDGCLPELPAPDDTSHHVRRPSEEFFADCTNEFWWCTTSVAKGLARNEIAYAMHVLHVVVRPMLMQMLSWEAGVRHNFNVNTGKFGRYLDRYVPEDRWQRLLVTHCRADVEEAWAALELACELFGDSARVVASRLGYTYPESEADKVQSYLERVRVRVDV